MITDRERKNREELFKLMQENPELPVVAMVDSEIVQDDGYSRWMGAWGSSSIEEYFIGEERIHFREENYPGFAGVLQQYIFFYERGKQP